MLRSSHVTFAVLLLHLRASCGSQHSDPGQSAASVAACHITEHYTSPFVSAFVEHSEVMAGCISRQKSNTTSPGREVHLIHLLNGGGTNNRGSRVTLLIEPRADTGIHREPVLFILNTERPTIWKIHSERLDNTTRHHFWLTRDSRLVKSNAIRTRVKKYSMSMSCDEAVAWTRQNFGGLTSVAKVQQVPAIVQRIGVEPNAPSVCVVSDGFQSPYTKAVSLHAQSMLGCSVVENAGRQGSDVHIIELEAAQTTPWQRQPSVQVNIRAKQQPPPWKELLLVLRSSHKVQWHLTTAGVKGNLVIITDDHDSIETRGIRMQRVSVAVERYSSRGSEFIQWVSGAYGPPLSYTQLQVASSLDLVVDGAGGGADDTEGQGQDTRPKKVEDGEGDGSLNRYSKVGTVGDEGLSASPFDNPMDTQRILNASKRVSCPDQFITITLSKALLAPRGVLRHHVTLLDESCHAIENATHYILQSLVGKCGTIKKQERDSIFFENAIVVRRPASEPPSDDEDGDELSGSGIDSDDTLTDDEDYDSEASAIYTHFQCEVIHLRTTLRQPPGIQRTETGGRIEYDLRLYRSDSFSEPVTRFPVMITGKQKLYFEASVNAEPSLKPVVKACWVTRALGETDPTKIHRVIYKGCTRDITVEWHDGPTGSASERFEFLFTRYFDGGHMTYLVCEMSVCSTDQEYDSLPQCMTRERYCLISSMSEQVNSVHLTSAPTRVEHIGPLMIINPELPPGEGFMPPAAARRPEAEAGVHDDDDNDDDGTRVGQNAPSTEGGGSCTQVIHREGLDSGTVVGIAFAAFLIGALLTGALWYIHTHTGRGKCPLGRRANRPRSAETSGESTPSSTAPITIHQVHHH